MDKDHPSYVERLWEAGQQHLAALRYGPAVRALEAAERAAWRKKNGPELARLYLPLLEARRQIRYQAAEGTVLICPPGMPLTLERDAVRRFVEDESIVAGAVLVGCRDVQRALTYASVVMHTARRTGRWIEALLLLRHGDEVRLASPGDATFAGGLKVKWTEDPKEMIGGATDRDLEVPLPPASTATVFDGHHPLHPMLRESLITAWEALALKWQHRHPPFKFGGIWGEMAWLRLALRIDPACEPITMRLIALGEAAGRNT
jgi:hypothetical protein